MLAEAYVIGSIVFAVIFVTALYGSDPMFPSRQCSRCGAELPPEDLSGLDARLEMSVWIKRVVPEISVVTCPQCGYQIRSWACPVY